jgi:hypothetical protein
MGLDLDGIWDWCFHLGVCKVTMPAWVRYFEKEWITQTGVLLGGFLATCSFHTGYGFPLQNRLRELAFGFLLWAEITEEDRTAFGITRSVQLHP